MVAKPIFSGLCLLSLLAASCKPPCTADSVVPLTRAHAHNDYNHDRPLYDALALGFTSVEADVYLVDGELFVAHDRHEITQNRTLRKMYLKPLSNHIRQNAGRIYPDGPQFTLLIDIKSEPVPTYKALSKMLAEYDSILTTFGPNSRRDKAIVVIVSGNRPRELMQSQTIRYAGYDGRIEDLDSNISVTLMPLISDNWTKQFTWTGVGAMPPHEKEKLKKIVETAHKQSRRIRFWATPDNPSPARHALWQELIRAGVDLINTDDLKALQQFLLSESAQIDPYQGQTPMPKSRY